MDSSNATQTNPGGHFPGTHSSHDLASWRGSNSAGKATGRVALTSRISQFSLHFGCHCPAFSLCMATTCHQLHQILAWAPTPAPPCLRHAPGDLAAPSLLPPQPSRSCHPCLQLRFIRGGGHRERPHTRPPNLPSAHPHQASSHHRHWTRAAGGRVSHTGSCRTDTSPFKPAHWTAHGGVKWRGSCVRVPGVTRVLVP